MGKIWKSNLPDNLKRNFSRAKVKSILAYGPTTWSLKSKLEKKLDGAYTCMLRAALNKTWMGYLTNKVLYDNIPPLSKSICSDRFSFAGHC